MLSNVSKKLACLMFAGAMLGVAVAEAGTIPTNNVPLYTYATKKIYCYNSPGGAQKGYIDPGDDITITKVQSNGWVYGNYPTSKGRVSRWFKASDLLADRAANYTRYAPTATTNVYRNSSHKTTMGSVNKNEALTVVGGSGNSRQVIYKLSNGTGYKMGWLPASNCWTTNQLPGRKSTNTTSALVATSGYDWPVPGVYKINTKYTYSNGDKHSCRYYLNGKACGIDIATPIGTRVYAPADGVVRSKVDKGNTSFGKYFEILHNDGTVSLFAHLSDFSQVYNGKKVKKGDFIAKTGNTGGSTGPHLHYELSNTDTYQYYKNKGVIK